MREAVVTTLERYVAHPTVSWVASVIRQERTKKVDDTRIVLSGSVSAGTDADLAALDRIVETVRFR